MKKTILFCLAFCGLILVSYSCEKDPKPTPKPTYTNTELLTLSAWKIQNKYQKLYTDSVFKHTIIYECQWNGLLYFYTSGEVEEKYPSNCGALIIGGDNKLPWSFNEDETVLNIRLASYKIIELGEKSLILDRAVYFVSDGDTLQNVTRFEFGH